MNGKRLQLITSTSTTATSSWIKDKVMLTLSFNFDDTDTIIQPTFPVRIFSHLELNENNMTQAAIMAFILSPKGFVTLAKKYRTAIARLIDTHRESFIDIKLRAFHNEIIIDKELVNIKPVNGEQSSRYSLSGYSIKHIKTLQETGYKNFHGKPPAPVDGFKVYEPSSQKGETQVKLFNMFVQRCNKLFATKN